MNILVAGFWREVPGELGYQAADSWTHLTLLCQQTKVPSHRACS